MNAMPATSPTFASNACRLLVVEYENDARFSIAAALAAEGHVVETSSCPEDAAEELDVRRYDIVVAAPSMSSEGEGAFARLRTRHPSLSVVVLEEPEAPSATPGLERLGASELLGEPMNSYRLRTAFERALLQRRLRRLGAQGQFVEETLAHMYLVYQPVVRARSGCVVGYEALLRSSAAHFSGAGAFLSIARQLGREAEVDDRVRWNLAREFEDGTHLRTFFLNLHMGELSRGLLGTDRDPLVPFASRVIIEFGHELNLPDGAEVQETLDRARNLGYRFAVGDIAISRGDLWRLRMLHPEIYKLGASVVQRCDLDESKRQYIRKMVAMAHEEDALVVAQGIERPEEREVVMDLGCDLLQGFLIGITRASF